MALIPQLGAVGEFRARSGLAQGCLVYAVGGREESANLARDEFPALGGTGSGLSTVAGGHGPALATDGTANGFLTYGASADFNVGTGDFAFACLFRPDSITSRFVAFISGGMELLCGSSAGTLMLRLNGGSTQTSTVGSLNDSLYHMVVFSRRNGVGTFLVDGVTISSAAMATSVTATSGLTIGKRGATATYYAIPGVGMVGYWTRALSSDEMTMLSGDPFILTRPAFPERLLKAGGGAAYTLTCATGTFAVTGNAATLAATRVLAGAPGSFAVSGNAATLRRALRLSCSVGAFAISGNAGNLVSGHFIRGATGSFSISGNAASFPRAYVLQGAPGAFFITGMDAGLVDSAAPATVNFYPRVRRNRRDGG